MRRRTQPHRADSSSSGPGANAPVLDEQEQEELIQALRAYSKRKEHWHRKALIGLLLASLVVCVTCFASIKKTVSTLNSLTYSHLFVPIPPTYLGSFFARFVIFVCHDVAVLVIVSRHLLSLKPPPPPASLPPPTAPYEPLGMKIEDLQRMGNLKHLRTVTLVALALGASALPDPRLLAPGLVVGAVLLAELVLKDEQVEQLTALKYDYKGA